MTDNLDNLRARAEQAERERDAALEEARMMQDRLQRQIDGNLALKAEAAALRAALEQEEYPMSKYNNRRVRADGHTFDSAAEHRRYQELRLLESQGMLEQLSVHPKFALHVNGVKVADYVADFSYLDAETGALVVEDVKGVRTAVYRLKRKLLRAIHEIEITEIDV